MSEDTTQPVVDETKTPAVPGAAVDGARNDGTDLDTLLAQFNEETSPKPPPVSPTPAPVAPSQPQPDPLVAKLYNRFEREDINNLVKNVKGDLDYDDDIVEAWIDAKARKDPRLQKAWLQREANPQAFEGIAKELGREFAKRNSRKPDPALTEDREAVAAAVRGASTNRAPESPPANYSQMNHVEYRNKVRQEYGFDPG